MFCTQCGTKAAEAARFCQSCGAAFGDDVAVPTNGAAAPLAEAEPAPAIRTFDPSFQQAPARPVSAPEPSYSAYVEEEVEPRPIWKNPAVLGVAGALLIGLLVWGTRDFWLGGRKPAATNATAGASNGTAEASGPHYYAVRNVKRRNKPSTDGSVMGEVARGTDLKGTLEVGEDNKSQWLKLEDGSYISMANLSATAPPILSLMIDRTLTVDENTTVRAAPEDGAPPLDMLNPGGKVEAVGVANGWIEVTMKKSGVGYFKPSETSKLFGALSGKSVVETVKPKPSNAVAPPPIEAMPSVTPEDPRGPDPLAPEDGSGDDGAGNPQ